MTRKLSIASLMIFLLLSTNVSIGFKHHNVNNIEIIYSSNHNDFEIDVTSFGTYTFLE